MTGRNGLEPGKPCPVCGLLPVLRDRFGAVWCAPRCTSIELARLRLLQTLERRIGRLFCELNPPARFGVAKQGKAVGE